MKPLLKPHHEVFVSLICEATLASAPFLYAPPAWATTWTKVATEDQSFTVAASTRVRYGTGSKWIYKTLSGRGECSNHYFGDDPAHGIVKECDLQVLAAPAPSPAPTTAPSPAPAPAPTASPSPTPSPTPAPAPAPAATPAPASLPAGAIALSWIAPSGSVTGYRVYFGVASRVYAQIPGNGAFVTQTNMVTRGLTSGTTYYFAVTAVDQAGVESAYSAEATKLVP